MERKSGEIKLSLVLVFLMFAVLITVCWGWLGERYYVIASVLAWGLGDAAAALVGKRFGRRQIKGHMVEGTKTLEGSLAMLAIAFMVVLTILLASGAVPWYAACCIAVVVAIVCAVVELFSKGGMDTITTPFAAAATMIPLVTMLKV